MPLLPEKRGVSTLLRSSVIAIGLCSANSSLGSDYGTTGLIDIPTARMASDGYLTVGAAFDGLHQSYAVTYQALPWLEGTFRYTGFEDFFFWDRNYGFKVRLLEESEYLPQVAAGVRDAVGTGIFGSEYIVGSKQVGNFDLTAGLGWGRLAGKGQFGNPLSILDDRFGIRRHAGWKILEISEQSFFVGRTFLYLAALAMSFRSIA